jgi:hypothetical protein
VKHVYLFESLNELDKKDLALLDRILNHGERFLKMLDEIKSDKEFERFVNHFQFLKFIEAEPDKMAALLLKSVKNNERLRNWVGQNSDEFPEGFKKSVGLYSDLKNLGF